MKGKSTVILSLILVFTACTAARAAGDFGLGIILGDPSGITGKYFISKTDAIDGGIGDAMGDGFYLYGDYLRHFPGVIPVREMNLYIGGGGAFHHYHHDRKDKEDIDENRIELRMPFGVNYMFAKIPLEAFVELAPALSIVPHVDFDIRGGLGVRYYF